jgi:glycosyltransferase involved in cell wall biosynthesis
MEPAVSIIIPAYNVTPYIATALDSVFVQTFQNFEIIVINDGCPDSDNLERVLSAYQSRIHYIRQENGGVGAARKAAVEAARPPLIAQLDPDDWWEPDYLEVQLRLLESNPALDLIYANATYFGSPALEGRQVMDFAPSEGDVTLARLLEAKVNINYSALIRKDAILRAGNFDPDLHTSEDFDLWIRMLKAGGRMAYHRAPLLHYRIRQDSLTSGKLDAQRWVVRVLEKTENITTLTKDEQSALLKRKTAAQMEMELIQGKEAVKTRDWASARWHLEMYQRYRPTKKLSLILVFLRSCPRLLGAAMSTRDRLLKFGLLKAKRPQQA